MMPLLRGYRFYIVLVGVLFLSACSTTNSGTNSSFRVHESVKQPESGFVQLIIPAALDVLEIDSKEFKDSPGITEGQYQIDLLPGAHSFKVRYSQNWGSEALGYLVKTNSFYFTVETSAGNVYEFKHNGPEDLLDAEFEKTVDDINIWLEEYKNGQQKTANKIEAVGIYAYVTAFSSLTGEDEVVTIRTAGKGAAKQVPVAEEVQQKASEQLKFWWKIANAEQRKVFQDWLVTLKEATDSKTSDSMQQKATEQLKFWWKLADLKQRESFLLWVKK